MVESRAFLRHLGSGIAARRRARHLTQEKLAEALDTSPAWVSQLERGIGNPSLETLHRLALALGTTPGVLVETAGAVEALTADVRALVEIAQRLSPAATRVLLDTARSLEREGLVGGGETPPERRG